MRAILALIVLILIGAAAASATETITYTYDARGRLVQVSHSGTVNNNAVTNYTYDKADNRKTKTTSGAP
jgi:type II secretory pathway pseudopilin PulG